MATKIERFNFNQNTARNANGYVLMNGESSLRVHYSYNTIVACLGFIKGRYVELISQNEWGSTTGKHLNWIDRDKTKRIDHNEFMKQYRELERNFNIELESA